MTVESARMSLRNGVSRNIVISPNVIPAESVVMRCSTPCASVNMVLTWPLRIR